MATSTQQQLFFFFLSKLDKKILLKKDLSFLHIPEVESR